MGRQHEFRSDHAALFGVVADFSIVAAVKTVSYTHLIRPTAAGCHLASSFCGSVAEEKLHRIPFEMCIRDRGGVIASEIMLPPQAPEIYLDRATLDVYKRQILNELI